MELASQFRSASELAEALLALDERRGVSDSALLRVVLDAAPIIAFVVDRDGVIVSSSGRARAALYRRRGSSIGRRAAEIYADVPEVPEAIARALAGERATVKACVAGQWYEAAYVPAHDGSVIGVAVEVAPPPMAQARRGAGPAALGRGRPVLVVDADPMRRAGLRFWIDEAAGFRVVKAVADADAMAEALAAAPHPVALAVINAEGGLEPLARLGAVLPEARALVLDPRPTRGSLRRWREAGAAGVVSRTADSTTLLDALRTVAEHGTYVAPEHAALVAAPSPRALSSRQWQVLTRIARGQRYAEIADALGIDANTVGKHKRRGMRKLGLGSTADLVAHAIAQGWIEPPSAVA